MRYKTMDMVRDVDGQSNSQALPITSRLSTLWVFVMFNMLFADILSFMDKSFLNDLFNGYAGGVHITSGFLLLFAVMLEVPIAMTYLSKTLPYKVNRLTNIVAAVITILFVVGGGSSAPHYIFLASLEILALISIIRYSWKWADYKKK